MLPESEILYWSQRRKCSAGSSQCSVQLLASSGEGGQATEVWLNSLLFCPHAPRFFSFFKLFRLARVTSRCSLWSNNWLHKTLSHTCSIFPPETWQSLMCKISEAPRWGHGEAGLVSRAGHPWQAADSIVECEFAWFRFSDWSSWVITCCDFYD